MCLWIVVVGRWRRRRSRKTGGAQQLTASLSVWRFAFRACGPPSNHVECDRRRPPGGAPGAVHETAAAGVVSMGAGESLRRFPRFRRRRSLGQAQFGSDGGSGGRINSLQAENTGEAVHQGIARTARAENGATCARVRLPATKEA